MSMQGAVAKKKWEAIVEQTEPIIQGIEEASFTPSDLKRLASAIRSQSEIAGKVFQHQLSLYDQQVAKLNELIKDKLVANNIPATEANVQKVADKIFAGLVQHDWSDIVKKVQKSLANDKASKKFQEKLDDIKNNTDKLAKKKDKNPILDLAKSSLFKKVMRVTIGLPLRLAVSKQLRHDFARYTLLPIKKLWHMFKHPILTMRKGLRKFLGLGAKFRKFILTKEVSALNYLGFSKDEGRSALNILDKPRKAITNKVKSILTAVSPNQTKVKNKKFKTRKAAEKAKAQAKQKDKEYRSKQIQKKKAEVKSNFQAMVQHDFVESYKPITKKAKQIRKSSSKRIDSFIDSFNAWREQLQLKEKAKDKWERVKTSKIGKLVGKSLDKYKKLYKESKDQIEEVGASNFFKSMLDKMGGWKYILGGGLAVAIGKALWDAFDVGEFLKKVGSSIWKWFVDLLPDSVKKIFGIEQPKISNAQLDLGSSGINQDKDYWSDFIGPDKKFEHLPDPTTTDYTKLSFAQKHDLSNDDPDIRRKIAEITVQQAKQKQSKLPSKPKINQQELDKKSSLSAYNTSSSFNAPDLTKPKTVNTKSVMADQVNTTDLSTPVPKREQAKGASNKQKAGTGAGNVFNLSTVPLYGRRDNDGLAVINTFSY